MSRGLKVLLGAGSVIRTTVGGGAGLPRGPRARPGSVSAGPALSGAACHAASPSCPGSSGSCPAEPSAP